jgi:hypothetical protein
MFAGTKTKIFGDDAPVVSRTIQQDDVHFSIKKPKADGGNVKRDVNVPGLEGPVAGDSKGVNLRGTGNVKHLDDVPRIKEVKVNFKRNDKHDSEEFARQLKDQEK